MKDLKSNDRVQIGLQNTFMEFYDDKVFYLIKRGEEASGNQAVISIDFAAQLIVGFYFEESYKTHLKTSFFSSDYEKIFSKNIDCHKIFLAYDIFSIINQNIDDVEDLKVRAYGLARYSILSMIKKILEDDSLGKQMIDNPKEFLTAEKLPVLEQSMRTLYKLVILDFNECIKDYINENEFFDYKNLFKNREFCEKLINNVFTQHKKSIIRHPEDSFEQIYNSTLS